MRGIFRRSSENYRDSLDARANEEAEEHFIKGKKLSIQGRHEEAIEEYNKTLAIDPEHRRARTGIDLIAALWGIPDRKGR